MSKEVEVNKSPRSEDRRKGGDRRKVHTDPATLPFPDRRKGERRQMDRRIVSEEEKKEIGKKIIPDGEDG
ncbi:hypothetical protein CEE37_14850 [candidate division LCP-89 bacterium B3_LCP]|uniref:Uncharacterized protein n=1 Tax=candidate division LCP-89 bacterium B3_LCP TaxID=2012998 RepID=A0A532UPK4_UNCL8|nr:MAG: hypothetical protein CEE37_14850 [candidate division LCP-89 bacterium B3_LCP]